MNTTNWYYSEGQQTNGPFAVEQIVTLIRSGLLTPDHLVVPEGSDVWQPLRASAFASLIAHHCSQQPALAAEPLIKTGPVPPTRRAAAPPPRGPHQPHPASPRRQPQAREASALRSAGARAGVGARNLVIGTAVLLVVAVGWSFLGGDKGPHERRITRRIEGESLNVLKQTGGEAEPQAMQNPNAIWSGGSHLWWHGGAANYNLDLEFNVEPGEAGRQRLKAAFTSSFDYGIIELSIDGVKLKGMVFDLQANEPVITGAYDLGVYDLAAGPHVLRIGLLDTSVINREKKDAYCVGLDYLQLEPPVSQAAVAVAGSNIAPAAQPSASFCTGEDHVRILNTSEVRHGRKSDDKSLPRFTWHPRKGFAEWAQYQWETPQAISECRVFWFDDSTTAAGGCALPAFWRLLYRDQSGAWMPMDAAIPSAERDSWNTVKFPAVKTTALRLAVQCQDGWSAGICHWQVLAADPASVADPKTRAHPDLFLGDLSPLRAQVNWAPYRVSTLGAPDIRDQNYIGVGAEPCAQFLWAHANSRIDFGIPAGYTRFTAFGVGIKNHRADVDPSQGHWKYIVKVDGNTLFESKELATYPGKEVLVDVAFPAGSRRLTLITDDCGDANSDHAHWAYPTLLTPDSQKRPDTPAVNLSSGPSATLPPPAAAPAPPPPAPPRVDAVVERPRESKRATAPRRAPAPAPALSASQLSPKMTRQCALRIPTMQFTDANLGDAVEFLRTQAAALDPAKEDVRIVIDPGVDVKAGRLNLDGKDVPLADALRLVADRTNARLTVIDEALHLQPR